MDAIIGNCYAALDQPAEAIRALEASLKDEPCEPSLCRRLARLYAQEENYAFALRIYEEALKADSMSADLYLESGMMHFNMENYKNAAGAFEMAARYGASGDADLYVNLGVAYLQQAAYDDAISNLKKRSSCGTQTSALCNTSPMPTLKSKATWKPPCNGTVYSCSSRKTLLQCSCSGNPISVQEK